MDSISVRNRSHKGIIQSNVNSFSTFYRIIDISLLIASYLLLVSLFEMQVEQLDILTELAIYITVYQLVAESFDIYRSWRAASLFLMMKYVSLACGGSALSLITASFFLPQWINFEHTFFVSWMGASFVLLLGWRLLLREMLFYCRKSGLNSRTAIIIGANQLGYSLANQLLANDQLGIQLQGVFDDRDESRLAHEFRNQVTGTVADALIKAKNNEVDYIYIAMPMSAEKRIMEILNLCSDTTATVFIIPNFFIYNLLNARWQNIGSIQTLSVFDTPFQGASELLKRLEDIVLASGILAVISIPMLVIAVAVKLTSKGPIIFKQRRYGLDGKPITVYKFRSMSVQENGSKVTQVTKNDPRVTPLGAFLRRTSLDELPQFINVLQGRMSVVGPRPHAVAHNEQYRKLIEGYMLRHKVRPGITGLAQVNGFRGETETINKMVQRVEYDLDYIHRWSVWLDIQIVLATVFKGVVNKNAY
ncbi:sugar transferase [Catenovulum agarivorans DS-2]|uniref:Sugar transferase n=1 Tax=Catenovulum agarivorans DS-2 TaxID=1328313 RepID=W7QVU9_9ALTE|nr:undecaprenyl-phosphate glucose phosphotransferase [Catenovulum agarivorans]EWH09415.1 sugar transferase [Catenovulum agarivorans DS-2]